MRALRSAWPEALMEALGLGLFMVSACAFGTLFEHPSSPVRLAIPNPIERRALMGLAMGLTAVALIYSPWGTRSGAHMNPAVTLAFTRLGRVPGRRAAAYLVAQFTGGVLGVAIMSWVLGPPLADPAVRYVVTQPGPLGTGAALAAETVISFLMMTAVLQASGRPRLVPYTGLFAGSLVALWILLEAPLSGMSMNPARTLASAAVARDWTAWWVYFVAPPLGMLAAAELHRRGGRARRGCAKLHHPTDVACVFCGRGGAPALAAAREPFPARRH